MTTLTEQIVGALRLILIAADTAASGRVRRDSIEIEGFGDLPEIVIRKVTAIPVAGPVGFTCWQLPLQIDIAVECDGENTSPDAAPEPLRAEVHTALFRDRTLGGLATDITVAPVAYGIDPENPAAGIAQCSYVIHYRTPENLL